MHSSAWPIEVILIEHKVVFMAVDTAVNINVAARKLKKATTWMLHTNLQPGSSEDLYNNKVSWWEPKISVTSSVSNQM